MKTNVEILRNLVLWCNSRNEYLNDNKTINQLLKEYFAYCELNNIEP